MGESRKKGIDEELSAPATEMDAPFSSDELANAAILIVLFLDENNNGEMENFRFHSHCTILRAKIEEYELRFI